MRTVNFEVDPQTTKIDTIVAMKYATCPSEMAGLDDEEKSSKYRHHKELNKLWEYLYAPTYKEHFRRYLPGELKELGVEQIIADNFRLGEGLTRVLRFRCKTEEVIYEFNLVLKYRIYIFLSQSLHNYATKSYFSLDETIDNSRVLYGLFRHIEDIVQTFFDHFNVFLEPHWYNRDGWHLKRLDLACDTRLGPTGVIQVLDKASMLELPGYDRTRIRNNYNVNFQPVFINGFQQHGKNKRDSKPSINLYNKSEELLGLLDPEMKHQVPRGWIRLELQFYQGQNRQCMAKGKLDNLRFKVRNESSFTNGELAEIFQEHDVLSTNLDLVEDTSAAYLHTLKEELRRIIYQNGGAMKKRSMASILGIAWENKKYLDTMVHDMMLSGELIRRGHRYYFNAERMNELARQYKGAGQ